MKAGKVDGSKRAPTFHELRHAHASAFIAAGGDVVELSARLGHRDPAITASVYSHEFERGQRSRERRARLDAMYGEGEMAREMATTDRDKPQQAGSVGEAQKVVIPLPKRH